MRKGKPRAVLRMTGDQHETLYRHLFPGDGLEAVSVALCGRRSDPDGHILCIHKLRLIPYDSCTDRHELRVSWSTAWFRDLIGEAACKGMAILKIHCHPGYYPRFSEIDDESDENLFPSVHGWTDDGLPHASCVMLPDGSLFGRFAMTDGTYIPIDRISVAGDDLRFFDRESSSAEVEGSEEQLRTRQAFGEKTTRMLTRLAVGIVGCSGTGSWVGEQLARLGAGRLVLVDLDKVERKNLNRIVATSAEDATLGKSKVEALAKRFATYGTCAVIRPIQRSVLDADSVKELASCDIVFGCMDGAEGRDVLNRIATFYSIPYIDVGVQLKTDGVGGVDVVCGSVHYLIPDGSSLLSRGVYTPERLQGESLRRTDPQRYNQEVKEGYIRGIAVDAPNVISINGFCASMAVNEFLARLHPFRDGSNGNYRWQQFDLVNSFIQGYRCDEACSVLSKYTGRGDATPLLNCNLIAS